MSRYTTRGNVELYFKSDGTYKALLIGHGKIINLGSLGEINELIFDLEEIKKKIIARSRKLFKRA